MDELVGEFAWFSILAAGLPDLYASAVFSQDFFDQPLEVVSSVLSGFAGLCDKLEIGAKGRQAQAAARSLMTRTVPLWSSIWDRCCADIELFSDARHQEDLALPLVELLYRFSGCYVAIHDRPPPKESFMPYLGLLLYVILDQDESPQTLVFSLRCLSLYAEDRPFDLHESDDAGRSLLPSSVTTPIGIEKLVLRFEKTLSLGQPMNYRSAHLCLLVVWALAASPGIRPYVDKHGIFEGVNRAINHLDGTHPEAEDRLRIWDLAQDILRLLHTGRTRIGTPECFEYARSVRGEDITDHFARGVKLAAEMNGDVIFDGHLDPTGRLWQAISDHNDIIHNLQGVSPAQRSNPIYAAPARLVEAMRTRAREVWWSSLCSLQVVEYRRWETDPAKSDYGSVIDVWKEYGNLLGLQEDVEKKRHQRDARHHCAWRGCPVYVERSPHALKACSGCGEAYYCGRECQNGDWKRHKKTHTKLKAP